MPSLTEVLAALLPKEAPLANQERRKADELENSPVIGGHVIIKIELANRHNILFKWVQELLSANVDADVRDFCHTSKFIQSPIVVGDNLISLVDAKALVVQLLRVIEEIETKGVS